ncbi:unnamed protein product [Danaus chrysippus]|uniref:(African queen) hypothetical protein n=1 Tax=Danaus chrysippus TaxID=151541 RepID=A0A8J2QRG0_9NEOP|nr:unnamed protein product [Danaus chrysippus]
MKVAALLVCVISLVGGAEIQLNGNGCPIDYTIEKLYRHPECNKYYQCLHGSLEERICPDGLLFNGNKNVCDWPVNVNCEKEAEEFLLKSCKCKPKDARAICAKKGSDGLLVAHEHCDKFYKCSNGKNVSMNCPPGLLYNPVESVCDYASNVKCGDRVIPSPDENKPEDENDNSDNNNNNDDNNGGDNNGPCNCVPDEAPAICGKAGSDGVLVAHEHCNKFYKCSHGRNVSMSCPSGLLYNPYKGWCDYPSNVECGDRVIPDPEEDKPDNGDNNNGNDDNNGADDDKPCNCDPDKAPAICGEPRSDGVLIAHEHCDKFYKCANGKNVPMNCPAGLFYNPHKQVCDYPSNVECGDRVNPNPGNDDDDCDDDNNGGDDNGPCNCDPDKAPVICGEPGSEGVLVAHEHCDKFYKCFNGKNVSMNCPAGLLYNPHKGWCDYPSNVKCGDRVIPDPEDEKPDNEDEDCDDDNGNDDNNGGDDNGPCNCDPDEAPAICGKPGSNGVLIAHEHCDKFYQCANGKNVTMNCPAGLLFNPYKQVCDYPSNVKCGDRIIPDPEDEKPDNEDEDCDDPEDEKPDNEDEDCDDDNNGGDDNGPCNCDPDEAPAICGKPGSDGVLIAHEHCDKFYQCANGKNVTMNCPAGLLFNPYKQVCDYPSNVKCGDRIIPDPEDEKPDNEDEDCDDPEDEKPDNEDEDCDDDNNGGDDNGPCNCDPDEAPAICGKPGSDGVLIAHEHCDKFYQCANGKNVTMNCPAGLLFNPYKQVCDYPSNVKCGDRIIPDPEDEKPDNEDEDCDDPEDEKPDNEDEDCDDDNGNDDNNGGDDDECNCVPDEAPIICARPGSHGKFIAHKHCNKFYVCTNGRNVTMNCPAGLLYNPYRQVCDYPSNVNCGDRIIPDPEDEKPEEEDDNGNDDDENGPCNCNPDEAPAICARPGSDGVLIAHEHCNKFYQCAHGRNVTMNCPAGLLYNPYKKFCDYPHNVQCNDRIIPDPEEPDNGNEDDNNGDDNDGPCNCNPEEAPEICARIGSDGTLIAHEYCNKYYICMHGRNVTMNCPEGLFYNPYKKWCDYLNNVKCGDRINPEQDKDTCNCSLSYALITCDSEDTNGKIVAHEMCNRFYSCSNYQPIELLCPKGLLFNAEKLICDWPSNVDCGERI